MTKKPTPPVGEPLPAVTARHADRFMANHTMEMARLYFGSSWGQACAAVDYHTALALPLSVVRSLHEVLGKILQNTETQGGVQ